MTTSAVTGTGNSAVAVDAGEVTEDEGDAQEVELPPPMEIQGHSFAGSKPTSQEDLHAKIVSSPPNFLFFKYFLNSLFILKLGQFNFDFWSYRFANRFLGKYQKNK